MKQTIEELTLKFMEIKKQNWIESSSHGKGNVGITFENLIGKERENFPIADYNGIEIKTSLKHTGRLNLNLFSATFDGPYIYGIQYLKNQYGWSDKELKEYKIFYATISATKLTKVNNHYFMKLEIDYYYKKIYLIILDKNKKLIEKSCFWNFRTLKEKLDKKIKYLAFIEAEKNTNITKHILDIQRLTFIKLKTLAHFYH